MAPGQTTVHQIVLNVNKFFQREQRRNKLLISLENPIKRTVEACGVSKRTVFRAKKNQRDACVAEVVENYHQEVAVPEPERCGKV
jgi:hypothetical protein